MERMEGELPIQNMRLVAISETFVAQTGSMCYDKTLSKTAKLTPMVRRKTAPTGS